MSIKDREIDQEEFARETDMDHHKLGNPGYLAVNRMNVENIIQDVRYQNLSTDKKHYVWDMYSGFDKDGNELPEEKTEDTFGNASILDLLMPMLGK